MRHRDKNSRARLGRQLNADFVVSGHIRSLGSRSLIITTIINEDYMKYGGWNKMSNDNSPKTAEDFVNRGNLHCEKGDFDQAIADYTEAIRLDPDYYNAYHNRGYTYYQVKNDYDTAIADYNQAIRLNPNGDTYLLRGLVYHEKGDYDTAIVDYTHVIEIDPNDGIAYVNRGSAYCEKGDYDTAIADYTQAIRLVLNYAPVYHHRALAYQAKGDTAGAEADFVKARELGYEG